MGFNIDIEKKKLTMEEETHMKIKDVFYQINMLDNYTNHEWFKELNIKKLRLFKSVSRSSSDHFQNQHIFY